MRIGAMKQIVSENRYDQINDTFGDFCRFVTTNDETFLPYNLTFEDIKNILSDQNMIGMRHVPNEFIKKVQDLDELAWIDSDAMWQ